MRLIIISNRLPITVKKHDTTFEYKQNSGGLVTGLKAVKESMPFLWLGNISGMVLNDDEKKTISKDCWELFKSIPVFVDAELNEMSYNGFCNGILWPLLHTFPDDVTFSETLFKAYTDYNQLFCEKVAEIAEEGDIIWVHDYHLMLLPLMLRQKIKKNIKIGYFLHTPFSIAEIFGSLPCAKEIIAGILGSDHVAFHSYDYLANFLDTCTMTMPNKKDFDPSNKDEKIMYVAGDLNVGNRSISFTAIPIGIDPKLFFDCIDKPETKSRIKELKAKFKDKTIILSVDRTDFIKGIPNRIKGYQRYLENSKNKDVVYMQIAVPSRADVPEYASLINTINTMTTELNSTVGNVDENYFYLANKSIPFEELCALYSVADICLISSLADGMNLVALEYIACQRDKKGILLLSEFAGCQSTLPGSIFFNSWNVNNIAKSIDYAIKMEKTEREERFNYNFDNVKTFTALKWAEDNVKSLQSISQEKVK